MCTGIIFTIILTRSLNPTEFGLWNLISSVIIYVLVIESIISYWSTREIARNLESAKTAFLASGMFSILGLFAYIVIAFLVGHQANVDQNVLLLGVVLVPVRFLNNTLTAINLGWKPHTITYATIAYGVSQIFILVIMIRAIGVGVTSVILAILIAYICSIVVLAISAKGKIKSHIKIEFLKKWLRLSWLPLYPGLVTVVSWLDFVIFSIMTGSVVGLAYWSVALASIVLIGNAGLISRAVYPKLLSGGNNEYLKQNITLVFYVSILFTATVITFARAELFVLNPLYEIAVPIVILLAVEAFFNNLSNVFLSFLTGAENVDADTKSSFRDYMKSKLFYLPTLRLIEYTVYMVSLFIVLLFFAQNTSQEQLLIYWAVIAVVTQVPVTIYLYVLVRKNFSLKLETSNIVKYFLISIGVFGSIYLLTDRLLQYENNIFVFIPHLAIFVTLGITCYVGVTYLVDLRTRSLFKAVIKEIKGKNR